MLPFEYLVPSVIKINKLQKNPTTKASPAMSILPLKCSNCWPQIFHWCLYFRQTWISSLRKQSKVFRLLAQTVYYNEVQNPSLFGSHYKMWTLSRVKIWTASSVLNWLSFNLDSRYSDLLLTYFVTVGTTCFTNLPWCLDPFVLNYFG